MKIKRQQFFESIKEDYPGLNFFQWEKYWNWYLEINRIFNSFDNEDELLRRWINDHKIGTPLGYILGQWAFYQDLFWVNHDVLIPRPETEMLVDKSIEQIKKPMTVLEIGVGSGALILSVMKHSPYPLQVLATDISSKALACAKKNYESKIYQMPHPHDIEFMQTDRTKGIKENFYDLILCNPPYIPENHPGISPQVKKFEPAIALFLPEKQYFTWMIELIQGIEKCLKIKGVAFLEGHEDFLIELKKQWDNISNGKMKSKLIFDLNQRPRFLELHKLPDAE